MHHPPRLLLTDALLLLPGISIAANDSTATGKPNSPVRPKETPRATPGSFPAWFRTVIFAESAAPPAIRDTCSSKAKSRTTAAPQRHALGQRHRRVKKIRARYLRSQMRRLQLQHQGGVQRERRHRHQGRRPWHRRPHLHIRLCKAAGHQSFWHAIAPRPSESRAFHAPARNCALTSDACTRHFSPAVSGMHHPLSAARDA